MLWGGNQGLSWKRSIWGRGLVIGDKLDYMKDGLVVIDDEVATSVNGVFRIGDVWNTVFKQAVVAASDGCIAAMSLFRYLKGRKTVRVSLIH